ncbi:hypothetical protein [Candidatus Manganitrophus noduliformans]|uniref:Uncharacterized protein n=1 Tax=Candidatus Manganitrophus noduliformans TaxID=2606439 RepID=A0A7X6DMF2_9BACT|nr:hypothetical protein [Candidatus Manganitrophus noduliformans]NKE69839.1 hypothetical protein [Candidatus Manganitrophus noduliformans]
MHSNDEIYGPRETARFNGAEQQILANACKALSIQKSDALRKGPEALILLPELQSKITEAEYVLSEMKKMLQGFISNMHVRSTSSKTFSDERLTPMERRRGFVGQVAYERRRA